MGNPRHVHVGQTRFPHHPSMYTAHHFPLSHKSFYIPFLPLVQNKNKKEKTSEKGGERERGVGCGLVGILNERKSRGENDKKERESRE